MLVTAVFNLFMLSAALASNPIVLLKPSCPMSVKGAPALSLTADIPAQAVARCQNGDSNLITVNDVHFSLAGTFGPMSVTEDCLFFKNDLYSYSVDVEVSWAERSRQKVLHKDIRTVSCMYDQHGIHVPSTGSKDYWFIAPKSPKTVPRSNQATTRLDLKVLDEEGNEIGSKISPGRRIRLEAQGNSIDSNTEFRALSCEATNGVNSQTILHAGCGDGEVLGTSEGFSRVGGKVVSPYFKAFSLPGGQSLTFSCKFTVCRSNCEQDSCHSKLGRRRKRSLLDIITASFVGVQSGPVFLTPLR